MMASSSSTCGRSEMMMRPPAGVMSVRDWIVKGGVRMNRYGLHARRRWSSINPQRVDAISNPQEFFTELGEQILIRVSELTDSIVAGQPAKEPVREREAQIATATKTAEEIVFAELVEISPPIEDDEPDWLALRQSFRELEDARDDWMSPMQYEQEKARLEEILRTGRLPRS